MDKTRDKMYPNLQRIIPCHKCGMEILAITAGITKAAVAKKEASCICKRCSSLERDSR